MQQVCFRVGIGRNQVRLTPKINFACTLNTGENCPLLDVITLQKKKAIHRTIVNSTYFHLFRGLTQYSYSLWAHTPSYSPLVTKPPGKGTPKAPSHKTSRAAQTHSSALFSRLTNISQSKLFMSKQAMKHKFILPALQLK